MALVIVDCYAVQDWVGADANTRRQQHRHLDLLDNVCILDPGSGVQAFSLHALPSSLSTHHQ